MSTKLRLFLAGALLLVLVGLGYTGNNVAAQQPWRYFPETGYWVGNEFLAFYDTHGGLDIYGYPITNETTSGEEITPDVPKVQYFQRARMEWHPKNPDPNKVQLGLLGSLLYGPAAPPVPPGSIPPATFPYAHYFTETGQVVGWAFWDFFKARGGLQIFGYPLSPEFVENGLPVQYFQRARMEWHPDNPDPYLVQLGLLGLEWQTQRLNPRPTPTLTPIPPPTPVGTPTRVRTPGPTPTPTPGLPPGEFPFLGTVALIAILVLVAIVGGFLWWQRDLWQDLWNRRTGSAERPSDTNLESPDGDKPIS